MVCCLGLVAVTNREEREEREGKKADLRISGTIMSQAVETEVDDEIAKNFFYQMTHQKVNGPNHEIRIKSAIDQLTGPDQITNENMALLSNAISTDFATLYLVDKLYRQPANRRAQNRYQDFLELLRSPRSPRSQKSQHDGRSSKEVTTALSDYVCVFVPGLFYKRHAELGGDFASQRQMFDRMGIKTHFIETDEVGTVEDNAKVIANELAVLNKSHEKIIVISASKGGPDLAFALGKLMPEADTKNIKAWISIGGVLRGSPIASQYLRGIKKWYARTVLFFIGTDLDFVEDLSHERGTARHATLSFPEHLLILHYVGAPLSGQVSSSVTKEYKRLSVLGPNDGLTTLVDQLTPQGIVITELGLDHYYRDSEIDKKSIALAHTVVDLIENK